MPRRPLLDNSPAIHFGTSDTCIVKKAGKNVCEIRRDSSRLLVSVPTEELESLPWKARIEEDGYLNIFKARCTFLNKKRVLKIYSWPIRKDGSFGKREMVLLKVNGIPRDIM